jgi:hypothetical protein
MEYANTCGVPAIARWRALSIAHKLHWLLRLGVVGCYIGHGAYGLLTKAAWVPFFGVVGIDRTWAYRLMPWIGAMDVGLGVTMAVVPLRVVPLHLTVWGLWKAALRPLSGDVVWECVERAGNYGVPLFDFVGQRDTLMQWADRKGEEGFMTPWKERNQWSVDDKPTGLLSA